MDKSKKHSPMQSESRLFRGTSATGQDGRLGSRSGRINAPEEGPGSVNEDHCLHTTSKLVDLLDFTEAR